MIYAHKDISTHDERGSILDIVQDIEFQHATIITSKAGTTRGQHYHKQTTQYVFVLSGRILLSWRTPGERSEHKTLNPGDLVAHPPLERHAVTALTDATFLVLTNGPRGGDHYESDTFREAV